MAKKTSLGITPAYAGKSRKQQQAQTPRQDHPRVCGEKETTGAAPVGGFGSPPHVRGKVCHVTSCGDFPRITPAYAGKSTFQEVSELYDWDHPRMCGEKEARQWPKKQVWGSPPHVRGKVGMSESSDELVRITPAYAGKSGWASPAACMATDHPRICGEKITLHIRANVSLGSPPRMRGKAKCAPLQCGFYWITPAYAGKSLTSRRQSLTSRDHPRVCGEKRRTPHGRLRNQGSPPRMRGKVHGSARRSHR